jgi:hypothetical protein
MIRADYCGNGIPYTRDGNPINVYDVFGIQTDTQSWPIDAGWNQHGAVCARKTRSLLPLPPCFAVLVLGQCGFQRGALVMNEFGGSPTTSVPQTIDALLP